MYLHCHTKGCGWSQDDFWDFHFTLKFWKFRAFGYNPLSLMIDDLRDYLKPRYIGMDSSWAKENGFKSTDIFSWRMMAWSLRRHFLRIFRQHWWTHKSWKKDYDKGAVCPNCKQQNFDID